MKQNNRVTRLLAVLAMVSLGLLVALQAQARNATPEEIAERLRPAGELCLEGMECGGVAAAPAAGGGAQRSGQEVYNSICMACHDTGVSGSPVIGDAAAWADRIAQGMDSMYANSINGMGVMPARGGNPNLSDEEVKAAVDYIVERSQ